MALQRKPRKDKGRKRCEIIAERWGCPPLTWDTRTYVIGPYKNGPVVAHRWLEKRDWVVMTRMYDGEILAVYDTRGEARDHLVLLRLVNGMNEDGTPTKD